VPNPRRAVRLGHLPDGDLIILEMRGRKLWRWSKGTLSEYADLGGIAAGTIDDMMVDAAGRAYVGDLGFDLFARRKPAGPPVGRLLVVTPGVAPRVVAEGLDFPNGIAIDAAAERLAVAESSGDSVAWFDVDTAGELALRGRSAGLLEPDGICPAPGGKLWVAQFRGDSFVCIDESGARHAEIAAPGMRAVACWLDEAEATLFCLSADTSHEQLMRRQSRARLAAVSL
jgi:sugar lactone lactonase YvrE